MNRLIIILAASLVLGACSPQKRLNRLIDRHPELVRTDTITFRDTVRTMTIQADTIIMWSQLNRTDTVTILKERLTVRFIRQNDSLQVKGECLGDTIYIEKKIPVETVVKVSNKKRRDWLPYFSYGFALGACVVFFLTIFLSFKFR